IGNRPFLCREAEMFREVIGFVVLLLAGYMARWVVGRLPWFRRRMLREELRRFFGKNPSTLPVVARTEGASPAFVKELLRKAALFAAESALMTNGALRVTDARCDEALRELVFAGGDLTRQLLGFEGNGSAAAAPGSEGER